MPRRRTLDLHKKSITFRPTKEQYHFILARCKSQGLTLSAFMRSLVGRDIDKYKGVTQIVYSSHAPDPPSADANRLRKRREERVRLASGLGALQIEAVNLINEQIKAGVTLKKHRGAKRRPLGEEERMRRKLLLDHPLDVNQA